MKIAETIIIGKNILDKLSNLLADHIPVGSPIRITTSSIQMALGRLTASELNYSIYEGLGKLVLPSFCDLVGNEANLSQSFSDYFDWNDLDNCTNEIITVQVFELNFRF